MSYAWRDPARVTPARLAELQARDARLAHLNARAEIATPAEKQAARKAAAARFAQLRESGMRVKEAAAAMGIGKDAARKYEAARKAASQEGTT